MTGVLLCKGTKAELVVVLLLSEAEERIDGFGVPFEVANGIDSGIDTAAAGVSDDVVDVDVEGFVSELEVEVEEGGFGRFTAAAPEEEEERLIIPGILVIGWVV